MSVYVCERVRVCVCVYVCSYSLLQILSPLCNFNQFFSFNYLILFRFLLTIISLSCSFILSSRCWWGKCVDRKWEINSVPATAKKEYAAWSSIKKTCHSTKKVLSCVYCDWFMLMLLSYSYLSLLVFGIALFVSLFLFLLFSWTISFYSAIFSMMLLFHIT